MSRLAEISTFFREFRQTYRTTGAVLPSSRFLARRLTTCFNELPPDSRILEAGPGTGAVSSTILERLRPGDHLTMVELNERFVEMLHRRFEKDARWAAKKPQVTIVQGAIEDLPAGERYHAVFCGLPFNNFEPSLVATLMQKLLEHVEPGGHFCFFEYLAIRKLKAPFVGGSERSRLRAVGRILSDYITRYQVSEHPVARNFPPALVHHLRAPVGGL